MATSKTLTPTNVTISIPEFTDQPDQRVNSNCIDKEADAINEAYSKLTPIVYPSFLNGKSAIETFIRDAVSSDSKYACAFINNTSKNDAITQGFNTSSGYLEIMEHNSMYADHPYFRFYAQNSFGFGRLNVTSSSITAEVFNDLTKKLNNYSGTHTISLLDDVGYVTLEFRNTNVSGMFTRLNIFDTGKVTISRYANGAWQTEVTLRNAD